MEEGASTSSFPSRTSPLEKQHTTHPIRTKVITTVIPSPVKMLVTSGEVPEKRGSDG